MHAIGTIGLLYPVEYLTPSHGGSLMTDPSGVKQYRVEDHPILERVTDEPGSSDKALQLFRDRVGSRGVEYARWFDETAELTKAQVDAVDTTLE